MRYLRAAGDASIDHALNSLGSHCPNVAYAPGLGVNVRITDNDGDNDCDSFKMGPGSLNSKDYFIKAILNAGRRSEILQARQSTPSPPDNDGDGIPNVFDGLGINSLDQAAMNFERTHPGNICLARRR